MFNLLLFKVTYISYFHFGPDQICIVIFFGGRNYTPSNTISKDRIQKIIQKKLQTCKLCSRLNYIQGLSVCLPTTFRNEPSWNVSRKCINIYFRHFWADIFSENVSPYIFCKFVPLGFGGEASLIDEWCLGTSRRHRSSMNDSSARVRSPRQAHIIRNAHVTAGQIYLTLCHMWMLGTDTLKDEYH